MEKKSSKIINGQGEKTSAESFVDAAKLRRFITVYDKLCATLRRRFDTEGDAVSLYVGKLGAVNNFTYRDELMITLVRCREIKNKFTRGELLPGNFVISDEDISTLISLEKRISRGKDPVSCHGRGVIVSKIKRYSHTAIYLLSAAVILALTVALFFAIKF